MRENMEKTVGIMFWDDKNAISEVRETTFLGEPAAYIEKEYLNRYSKTQVWQKILIFGKPNDYVSINFQHPAGDKVSAQLVSQIMASFQKEGSAVAAQPKTAPADWKLYEFQGLLFEAPTAPGASDCFAHPAGQSFVCSNWSDKNLRIDVAYQAYAQYERQRSAVELAAQDVELDKEIKAKDTQKTEYKTEIYPINFGEAVKVTSSEAWSTTQTIFIRRGNAFWKVTVYHFNRWDAVCDAAKRAAGSIKFKN